MTPDILEGDSWYCRGDVDNAARDVPVRIEYVEVPTIFQAARDRKIGDFLNVGTIVNGVEEALTVRRDNTAPLILLAQEFRQAFQKTQE